MGWYVLHTCIAWYRVSIPAFDTRGKRWRSILTPAFAHAEKPKPQVSQSVWMLFRSTALQFITQNFNSTNSRFLASTLDYLWTVILFLWPCNPFLINHHVFIWFFLVICVIFCIFYLTASIFKWFLCLFDTFVFEMENRSLKGKKVQKIKINTIPLCILHWYHYHGTRYWYL